MFKSGDWIIEIQSGEIGTVSKIFENGVTAQFGKRVAIRKNENVTLAPLDIQNEDIATMIDMALQTGDKEWFQELTERMGVELHG